MTPEERRERLASVFNRILARAIGDTAWAGSPAERAAVQDYAALSRQVGDLGHWADAAWLASLLLERADELEAAERVIVEVREGQDAARRNVAALGRRAAVTGKYAFLPARLAALRLRLGQDAAAVFDAIEWAKCRALSDAAGADEPPRLDTLRDALLGTRTHYLTFLLDTERTFAVLLTADGTATSARLPPGSAVLAALADPRLIAPAGRHGVNDNIFLPTVDWTEALAPLAAPLDDAWKAGRIAAGDTLLVSPHALLHLFPLHELALRSADGRAAGEVLAIARVHGAANVLRSLAEPPGRPARALALRAPQESELHDVTYAEGFMRCHRTLAARLPGGASVLDGADATAEAVLRHLAPDTLLHLASHGDTLLRGKREERSFLLLASDGQLPVCAPAGARVPAGALTPAILLHHLERSAAEDPKPLLGAHVTLQACVSGHAAANPQGDAVGLEWAFLMAGASSTLGTHWHVDRNDAALFLQAFYQAWLGGSSRVVAWATAGAALRQAHPGPRWAAFSLTGDWR